MNRLITATTILLATGCGSDASSTPQPTTPRITLDRAWANERVDDLDTIATALDGMLACASGDPGVVPECVAVEVDPLEQAVNDLQTALSDATRVADGECRRQLRVASGSADRATASLEGLVEALEVDARGGTSVQQDAAALGVAEASVGVSSSIASWSGSAADAVRECVGLS